jgi:hypothetical protein
MKKLWIIAIFVFLFGCSFAAQEPLQLEETNSPRKVFKEEALSQKKGSKTAEQYYSDDGYLQPDATRGYIENQAWPYVPKVWLLTPDGRKIILVGSETDPPRRVRPGGIYEFNFPPGRYVFLIQRWRFSRYYGGWDRVGPVERVEARIEIGHRKWGSNDYHEGQYSWYIVVRSNRTYVRD